MVSIHALTVAAWVSFALGALIIGTLAFRKENPIASYLLMAWTILRVYRQFLLVWIQDNPSHEMMMLFRTNFLGLMLGIPIIYFFVRAFTEEEFSLRKVSPLHLVPFLGSVVWFAWIWNSSLGRMEVYPYVETYRWNIVFLLMTVVYAVLIIKRVTEFKLALLNTRSNLGIYRLPLLKLIIGCCLILVLASFSDFSTGAGVRFWSISLGIALLGLFLMAGLIMRQTDVFRVELPSEPSIVLEDNELERLKKSLAKILEEQKLYLDPQLRLKDLAEAMGVKSYRLSAVLRQGLHTTFYNLINQMRIDHAKGLLASKDQTMNILGIASESGFNSKSAFNELFKKYSHSTPSEFRRKVLQT